MMGWSRMKDDGRTMRWSSCMASSPARARRLPAALPSYAKHHLPWPGSLFRPPQAATAAETGSLCCPWLRPWTDAWASLMHESRLWSLPVAGGAGDVSRCSGGGDPRMWRWASLDLPWTSQLASWHRTSGCCICSNSCHQVKQITQCHVLKSHTSSYLREVSSKWEHPTAETYCHVPWRR